MEKGQKGCHSILYLPYIPCQLKLQKDQLFCIHQYMDATVARGPQLDADVTLVFYNS